MMATEAESNQDLEFQLETLAGTFATSFDVSLEPNKITAPHPRFSEYKNAGKTSEGNQEERRRKRLEEQKKKRQEWQDKMRCLEGDVTSDDSTSMDSSFCADDDEQNMDCSSYSQSSFHHKDFKNKLMRSEWLVDIPSDFVEKWLMVLCPIGKRCLVVASKGSTKAFARNGSSLMTSFPSLLPGGNKTQSRSRRNSCTLDCIYSSELKTFFILDMIACNGLTFYGSDTSFRFYWIQSKIEHEIGPSIEKSHQDNKYPFRILPKFKCDNSSIIAALEKPPFDTQLDGLLFFHVDGLYTTNVTPLVCWLKQDMIEQVIGIRTFSLPTASS